MSRKIFVGDVDCTLPELPPGPRAEYCAWCGDQLQAHDDAWRRMKSPEGRVVAASYCQASHLARALKEPQVVLEYLSLRVACGE